MPQLNTLIISNNPIVNVSGGVFSGFQHLALLEMTDTAVTAIPESFLAMLPMLNTVQPLPFGDKGCCPWPLTHHPPSRPT